MQKAMYMSFGAMFGITLTLLIFVLANRNENFVLAQTANRIPDSSGGMIVATGGSTANINDLVWVVKKSGGKTFLACYRWVQNMKMQLAATRKIDDDLKVIELNNMPPTVSDVHREVQKAEDEEAKKKAAQDKLQQKAKGQNQGQDQSQNTPSDQ